MILGDLRWLGGHFEVILCENEVVLGDSDAILRWFWGEREEVAGFIDIPYENNRFQPGQEVEMM